MNLKKENLVFKSASKTPIPTDHQEFIIKLIQSFNKGKSKIDDKFKFNLGTDKERYLQIVNFKDGETNHSFIVPNPSEIIEDDVVVFVRNRHPQFNLRLVH